jgi:hypothetical protein
MHGNGPLWLTVFEGPGNDAQAGQMFVVGRNRPSELNATLRYIVRELSLFPSRSPQRDQHPQVGPAVRIRFPPARSQVRTLRPGGSEARLLPTLAVCDLGDRSELILSGILARRLSAALFYNVKEFQPRLAPAPGTIVQPVQPVLDRCPVSDV